MKSKTVAIIGFPMDLGAGRRGVDMGPSALRIADVSQKIHDLGYHVRDYGNIPIMTAETQEIKDPKLKYLPEITRACEELAKKTRKVLDAEEFPLILGGDHSMSIGSIAGISAHCRENGKRLGVVWIDAHTDINTPETTPSGNIHGMSVAVSLGHGSKKLTSIMGNFRKLQPENIAIIGARSIDDGERETIKKLKVPVYTMYDIDKEGMFTIAERVISTFRKTVDHIHVSFDVDSTDPSIVKGVGTPVPGGLSFREAHLIMEMLSESGKVGSMEVAEVNPILDDMNQSAHFATGIITSCLGKTIL